MAKTPVITSLQPDQLQLFTEFVDTLRVDNTTLASEESDKIRPYLDAFAETLAEDKRTAGIRNADLTGLTRPEALLALFNRMAERTKNTLLSGLLIAPESLLRTEQANDHTEHFGGPIHYNGHSFTFGFLQIFTEGEKSSTAINVLAFNPALMEAIEPFKPAALLQALQAAATSSNHDMHHHYTSPQISSNIAKTMQDNSLPKPTVAFDSWWDKYFGPYNKDSDPYSYESALTLNHARIRRLLEEGPAGEQLKNDCDDFFEELTRIGKEMTTATSIEQAHEAVDYFGTMLIFALARSMPLDHPLMNHVISRLQQADPDPGLLEKKATDIYDTINGNIKLIDSEDDPDIRPYERHAIANYKAKGVELMPEKPEEADYPTLKKLQLMMIQPWIIHLLSPPQPKTQLAKMHDRLGELYLTMMQSSASTAWFNAVDGRRRTKQPNGGMVETYIKNGKLDRDDGPAYIKKDATGKIVEEQWFKEGRRYRDDGGPDFISVSAHNARIEKWFKEAGHECRRIEIRADGARKETWQNDKGYPHRTDGPAILHTDAQGNTTREEWQLDGAYHREDGPACTVNKSDGTHIETWYREGYMHRDGGPARTFTDAQGNLIREQWLQNGAYNRDDGPALIEVAENGTHTETWYKKGNIHRDGGPAIVVKDADGKIIKESWYIDGERHREDGPAHVEKKTDGSYLEFWCKNGSFHRQEGPTYIEIAANGTRTETWYNEEGKKHRDDGPAKVETYPDGSRKEEWFKNGESVREETISTEKVSRKSKKTKTTPSRQLR